ncbi:MULTISPECIES: hypothetical protein [Rhodococcus]|uniref:Uncharacterized protein n=2 Tax=Rhodococcus TaxID=1827 RepID=A0A0M8PKI4_RHORH|nr:MULTISPECIES: hypothetical protein [Rhodococcus]KOS54049.1 hypothetical protein Z051_22320 [Rhodococcus rhodochrous KG-21]MDM7486827.1 hypothetical protein [Rhodococcus indonesiensis]
MKHFRIVDRDGAVIDQQSFETEDEALAWAHTHPRSGAPEWTLEEQVGHDWEERENRERP